MELRSELLQNCPSCCPTAAPTLAPSVAPESASSAVVVVVIVQASVFLAVAFFTTSSCIHATYLKLVLCFKSTTERDSAASKDLELEQGLTTGGTVDGRTQFEMACLTQHKNVEEPDEPPPAAAEMATIEDALTQPKHAEEPKGPPHAAA